VRKALIPMCAAVASIIGGGWLFATIERIPVTTGIYWALTTASTVGFGDVTPRHPAGRLIAVMVMLTAIPSLAAVFGVLTSAHIARRIRRHHAAARADAAAAKQIAADLYRHQTGKNHPLAGREDR
jgi:voltage-gated potassium channel Kch